MLRSLLFHHSINLMVSSVGTHLTDTFLSLSTRPLLIKFSKSLAKTCLSITKIKKNDHYLCVSGVTPPYDMFQPKGELEKFDRVGSEKILNFCFWNAVQCCTLLGWLAESYAALLLLAIL